MKNRIRYITVALAVVFGLMLVSDLAHAQPARSGFDSAAVCGKCHVTIHKGWKGSMHANAVSDPVFRSAFLDASQETGGKSNRLCLSCHSPTTRLTQDFESKNSLTQEGVTCDFCHSVKEMKADPSSPFVLAPGKTKWGPLKGGSSPYHETAYAPHFEQSNFCGGCHEYVNERGVTILGTYSEWKESRFPKEGKPCQTCHMPRREGEISSPMNPKAVVEESFINSHEAAGGHSVEMVKKAVTMKLGDVVRSGDKIHAVVILENVGSGHKVPTGLPTRKLVLDFQAALQGDPFFSQERIFQKKVVNQKGEVITKDSDVFLNVSAIKEDNRLEPGKLREEHFEFIAPAGKPVELKAQLHYLYQPQQNKNMEMKIEMGSLTREVSAK